jgi:uncharacterized membrane protein
MTLLVAPELNVVVAVAPSSGSYRDVDHRAGLIVAAAALAVLLAVHFRGAPFPEEWIVPPTIAAYVLATLASSRAPALRRLLSGAARRGRQVRRAARAAFVTERIHADAERRGLLVYVSRLERAVTILPDHGVAGRVDDATWHRLARELEGDLAAATNPEKLGPLLEARAGAKARIEVRGATP